MKKKSEKTKPQAYKNASLSPAKRVRDLLSRMKLEEKAAQMMCVWQQKADTLVDAAGNFDPAKATAAFKKGYGLGQVVRDSASPLRDSDDGKRLFIHLLCHQCSLSGLVQDK